MEVIIVEKDCEKYLKGIAGQKLILKVDDVVELVNLCIENRVAKIMLFAENLTDNFFKLSSCEAGNILQKFRNYRIKVAAILPKDIVSQGIFSEMVLEENRGSDLEYLPIKRQPKNG